jgi:PAS domain S-box-containing protein
MTKTDNLILFIDDEETNLELFDASFSRFYKIHLAPSTKKAEELIANHQFKVIVSDINMPTETGLNFFKRIHFSGVEPILIILSAHINSNLLLEALNQGKIFRYLTKPWNYEEVKFSIDNAIQLFDLHHNNVILNQEIAESWKSFQNIFQSSDDGIVLLNSDNVIVEVNKAFSKKLGSIYPVIIGVNLSEYIPFEMHPGFWESITKLDDNTISKSEFEYCPDLETKKYFEVVNSKIEYKREMVTMSIFKDITERRLNEKKILNAVIQAEEKERSRLAKELHDGLGPIMATLKMYIEWLNDQEKITDHPDVLNLTLNSINEAIITLKSISNNLSPHVLENFGLVSALTTYIEKVKKVSAVTFILSLNIDVRFALAIEMSIYRIITECINNTIKHADATEIRLDIWKEIDSIFFKYADNGKGFNINGIDDLNTGMGIYNMKNRIKTLGGKLNIQSKVGEGFKLESEIPIH